MCWDIVLLEEDKFFQTFSCLILQRIIKEHMPLLESIMNSIFLLFIIYAYTCETTLKEEGRTKILPDE